MNKKRLLFQIGFFLQTSIMMLAFNDAIRHFLLKIFGYFIFFLPIGVVYLNVLLGLGACFILADSILTCLPYKCCGTLGEYLILGVQKLYYLPILFGLFFVLYFFVKNNKKANSVFDVADKIVTENKVENRGDLLIKLLRKYSIQAEIKGIEFGALYTRYYLNIPNEVKFSRFAALSPELTAVLKLKTRTSCDLQYSYIEVENENKRKIYIKEFEKYIQPNKLLLLDGNTPFLLDISNNFLCFVSSSVIHSFICSILITKIDFEILIIGDNDLSFVVFSNLILNSVSATVEDILKEVERRHRIIIPVAEDIYQYNQNQKEKVSFVMTFIKISETLDENILNYILQFGKRVGIFVCVYSDNYESVLKYLSFFSTMFISEVPSKMISIDFLGVSGAEYLCDTHDCILKYGELFARVGIPKISYDEITRIVKYLELNKS